MAELYDDLPLGVLKPIPALPETRREPRCVVDARVWLKSRHGLDRASLVDLSREGAFVETDLDLAPGTALRLRCFLPDGGSPFSLWARSVRRSRDGDRCRGLGLRFAHLRREARERIDRFLERRAAIDRWSAQYAI
ncbi:MAG: PilZ domain-containing protein [Deltaproteobacteria bacterium]|nr:PilZ domain-containing protein [Deltaproteobacteria bacterium]